MTAKRTMDAAANRADVFDAVKRIFKAYESQCVVLHDLPGKYYLATHEVRARDGYRTWFGGVETKKAYVSAHLMPVYAHPDLLATLSDDLKSRMQGKSCFNFKAVEPALLAEFKALTAAALRRFKADGRL